MRIKDYPLDPQIDQRDVSDIILQTELWLIYLEGNILIFFGSKPNRWKVYLNNNCGKLIGIASYTHIFSRYYR